MAINNNKRTFIKALLSMPLIGGGLYFGLKFSRPKIVVVGGGCAGLEFIESIIDKIDVDITLIEEKPAYHSCFMSNAALVEMKEHPKIKFDYQTFIKRAGIRFIQDKALSIDSNTKRIICASGEYVEYDYLITAPGIGFIYDNVEGVSENNTLSYPHGWKGEQSFLALKDKLQQLPDGQPFIIIAPDKIYKCPPGPYERAGLVADYLRHHKPNSYVLILDSKSSFTKQDAFVEGWKKHYQFGTQNSLIKYLSKEAGGQVTRIKGNKVFAKAGTFESECINFIPRQRAGDFALNNGLTNASGWCPINFDTMASTLLPNTYVLGDAAIAGDMPKSAFSAANQARICANAVVAEITKTTLKPSVYHNVCYSLIAPNYGISISAAYKRDYDDPWIRLIPEQTGITPLQSEPWIYRAESRQALDTFNRIIASKFNK
ncbi:FCSD flavin-binding domain-containing protein [Pseudoalteromonas sp. S16_S37]|uniref:FCSD flavin-binding domain-containing protein n=1 Tax=Pseudoalteromonas sp. S16_S37 TaxID=2720228 RepID=UPI00168147AB|nr:FAD-dependent oxidoreductase [Pseudoalteromonas sp. S16_S37]MBD1583320.1 FAD-dependent oxidoreductase [Pseudoalteromonas sp. S16_S37]